MPQDTYLNLFEPELRSRAKAGSQWRLTAKTEAGAAMANPAAATGGRF
jgi:hypothetical protein